MIVTQILNAYIQGHTQGGISDPDLSIEIPTLKHFLYDTRYNTIFYTI